MLRVENLTVRSGDFVLRDVSLALEKGECGVIVGPSGAGKSTLLEAIAGLREIERGRIILGGQEITNLPPEQRSIAFVPQDYALFPHLTAQGNILLAPRLLGMPKDKITERFEFLCSLLNLKELLHRRPKQLSGGERQRVALARALMLDPMLLLLDEPFAALDPQMRPSVRRSLRQIFKTLETTVLIVTHDLWDAAALGDKVFVIEDGRIVQSGSWSEVISNPQSDFVAEFVGLNQIVGTIVRRDGKAFLQVGKLLLPINSDLPEGTNASLKFFPSQVEIVSNDERAAWLGKVEEVMDLGDKVHLAVSVADGLVVKVETSPKGFKIGDEVAFVVKGQVFARD
jgi:molybdate/tungstate transport system ATP-binding protein